MALTTIYVVGRPPDPDPDPMVDYDCEMVMYGIKDGARFIRLRKETRTASNVTRRDQEFSGAATYDLSMALNVAAQALDKMERDRAGTNVFVCAEQSGESLDIWYGPVLTKDACEDQTGLSANSVVIKLKPDGTQAVVDTWSGSAWVAA